MYHIKSVTLTLGGNEGLIDDIWLLAACIACNRGAI